MRRAPGAQVLGRTGAHAGSPRHQQLAGDALAGNAVAARRASIEMRVECRAGLGRRRRRRRMPRTGARGPGTYSSLLHHIRLLPSRSGFADRRRRAPIGSAALARLLRPRRTSVGLHEPPRGCSNSARRPREIRDITVPIGTSSTPAISAYVNSSTSRSHTACRNASGSASSAAWRSASSVARVSSCSGENSSSRIAGGLLDRLAVDVNRIAPVVPAHVPKRVVEDREQPRLQVGAALELRRRPERLQVGVLHQVLGIRGTPRQPQRRAVEAVDVRERLGRKRRRRPHPPARRRQAAGLGQLPAAERTSVGERRRNTMASKTDARKGEHRRAVGLFLCIVLESPAEDRPKRGRRRCRAG